MVEIPEHIKKVAEEAVKKKTLVIGTTDKKCIPNTVPLSAIGYPKIIDSDKFVVIDNYLYKTRKNLDENPFASLTFWIPETHEGYQVKGPVEIKTSGDLYEKIRAEIKSKVIKLPAKAVIILKVEEIYSIKPGSEAGKRIL